MIRFQKALPVLTLAITLGLGSSCAEPRSASINQHIGADFTAMDDTLYSSSRKEIARACELTYDTRNDENRIVSVQALGTGSLVTSVIAGSIHFTNVAHGGDKLWTLDTGITATHVSAFGSISDHADLGAICLSLTLKLGVIRTMTYACDAHVGQLIRVADADDTYCAQHMSTVLPRFQFSHAKLEGSTGADSFAALLRLSQPNASAERAHDAVHSQLEAFSSGTNAWLAEAAASVLIKN